MQTQECSLAQSCSVFNGEEVERESPSSWPLCEANTEVLCHCVSEGESWASSRWNQPPGSGYSVSAEPPSLGNVQQRARLNVGHESEQSEKIVFSLLVSCTAGAFQSRSPDSIISTFYSLSSRPSVSVVQTGAVFPHRGMEELWGDLEGQLDVITFISCWHLNESSPCFSIVPNFLQQILYLCLIEAQTATHANQVTDHAITSKRIVCKNQSWYSEKTRNLWKALDPKNKPKKNHFVHIINQSPNRSGYMCTRHIVRERTWCWHDI